MKNMWQSSTCWEAYLHDELHNLHSTDQKSLWIVLQSESL
jgi:hypothetical protein